MADDDKVEGKYRDLSEILLILAYLYFFLQDKGIISLNWFNEVDVFKIAIGADGAPFGKDDEATAFLLSFLNIEGKVASCNDNFLIFGANCGEEHEAAKRYCSRLMDNIVNIEANSFSITGRNNVKFQFSLVPADMKWLATYAGETNNAFHHFSTFANVNADNKATLNGFLGDNVTSTWQPWKYNDRLKNARLIAEFKNDPKKVKPHLALATKRKKVLDEMRMLHTRNEHVPILRNLVDKAYAEPLHNTNNAWQQWNSGFWEFVVQLTPDAATSQYKTVDSLPVGTPIKTYAHCLKTKVKAGRVYKKVIAWYGQ